MDFSKLGAGHKTSGQTIRSCGWTKPDPVLKTDDTGPVGWRDQELPDLRNDWNRVKLCHGCQPPEFLPAKA